jgi:hypothetical protein
MHTTGKLVILAAVILQANGILHGIGSQLLAGGGFKYLRRGMRYSSSEV